MMIKFIVKLWPSRGLHTILCLFLLCSGLSYTSLAMSEPPNEDAVEEQESPTLSEFVRDEIRRQGGAPLPILVPYWLTRDADTARAHGFALKITKEGYTAVLSEEVRDLVITGTIEKFRRSRADSAHSAPETTSSGSGMMGDSDHFASGMMLLNPDYVMPYEEFDDGRGGTISFGFADCDYQVEFYCKRISDDDHPDCIDASEAQSFVSDLLSN